jgi:hypothetical protein
MYANPTDVCILGTGKPDATARGGYDYSYLFPVCPQVSWDSLNNSVSFTVDTAGWTSNVTHQIGDLTTLTKLLKYTSAGSNLIGSTTALVMPATSATVVSARTNEIQSLAFVAIPPTTTTPVYPTPNTVQAFVLQTPNTKPMSIGSASISNQSGGNITVTIPIGIQTTGTVTTYRFPLPTTPAYNSSMTLYHDISAPQLFIYKSGVLWRTVTPNLLSGGTTTIDFPISWGQYYLNNPDPVETISQGSFVGTYQYSFTADYGFNDYSFSFQAQLSTEYGDNLDMFSFKAINLTSQLVYNTTSSGNYVNNSGYGFSGNLDWQGAFKAPNQPNGTNTSVTTLPTGFQSSLISFSLASPAVPNPQLNITGSLNDNLNPLSYGALNFNLFFNPALYQMLSGFSAIHQNPWKGVDITDDGQGWLPPNSLSGGKYFYPCSYKLNFFNTGNTNVHTYPSSYQATNHTYVGAVIAQEYSSIHNLSPIASIVFCSNTLPVVSSQVSTPLVYSNGNIMVSTGLNADTANIITDLTSDTGEYRPFLVFEPTAQYRYVSLLGSLPLENIDLSVFWRTRSGQLVPFKLASGSTVTIKLAFIKKTSVTKN